MRRLQRSFPSRSSGARFVGLAIVALAASCTLHVDPDEEPPPVVPEIDLAEPSSFRPGQEAPDFVLNDLRGEPHRLAEHRGRIVVLEWFDPGCTFVEFGHRAGALSELSQRLTAEGVVWLAINSTARGKPGSGLEENRRFAEEHGIRVPILLDDQGAVGRAFGATETPECFVIDAEGRLAYRGPVDDAPFGKVKGGGAPTQYVLEAVEALRAGEEIPRRRTRLYGCAIKYRGPG